MRRKSAFLWLFLHFSGLALAQSSFIPLNEDYYQRIDRYEIKAGKIYPQIFTGVKQYKRSDVIAFIDSINADGHSTSKSDQFNRAYILNDSWEWSQAEEANSQKPILKHFYKKKADFYSYHSEEFDVHINPILYIGAGADSRLSDDQLFINTRGAEVRGMIDGKVGFYTYLTENQMVMPEYVNEERTRIGAVPHEGFWKGYKGGPGVDFLQARGYITFEATKHINLQFGHDRFFIGNGHRSMILSDYSPPGLFLKGNVKVWKLNYLFLINRYTAEPRGNAGGSFGDSGYPEKFVALHHFSINVGKKLNIGVFESVVFGADSLNQGKFDFAYANPIIFYRAIEHQTGSRDNVLLGADFKWNAIKKVQLYGQLTLDEFLLDNIRARNGWWANKFAAQAGLKYIDAFGVSNLDVQGELNVVRPFTFSHYTQYGSYSNFNQSLTHPLGSNFQELLGIIRYQPVPKLTLTAKLIMIKTGRDGANENWGGNILKNYTTRQQDFNNTIGQGIQQDIMYGSFTGSWMLKHNLFIDAVLITRDSKSPDPLYLNTSTITTLSLRWNIAQRHYEF